VACLVSVYLVRISHVHARSTANFAADQGADTKAKKVPGRLTWLLGIALLLLTGISYLYLYYDALHGYHEVVPVYLFAGVGLACALVWAYLFAKLLQ
jgi:putative flippase GtrA